MNVSTAELIPNFLPVYKVGKVRTVYDLGTELLIVASDRISAFDYILPDLIPEKGKILTEMSSFWFSKTSHIIKNHLISDHFEDFPPICAPYRNELEGRSVRVKKTDLIEIECVVRGYIIGTGWKDYQSTGEVCGHRLPSGLQMADALAEPIFTPASKAQTGHDENISVKEVADRVGASLAKKLEETSLNLYNFAREHALIKGIIIADTKFEFGLIGDELILIDEIFTPDSSRFWPADRYKPGQSPPSFDKQIVRDYLESSGWDKRPPPPHLPREVIQKTNAEYRRIRDCLMG